MWKIRIDELAYLMHEENLLHYQRKGFNQKFLEEGEQNSLLVYKFIR